jgi:hypothetical protein
MQMMKRIHAAPSTADRSRRRKSFPAKEIGEFSGRSPNVGSKSNATVLIRLFRFEQPAQRDSDSIEVITPK